MLSIVDMCFFAADLCSPERSFGALHRVSGAGKSGSLELRLAGVREPQVGSSLELRPTRHSAPRLSPGLRPPPLCRCAERHADLSRPALGHAKVVKTWEPNAMGMKAMGTNALGSQSLRTTTAGSRGQWGECCSEIKEEAEGRGTFAEAFTPLPSASTDARAPNDPHQLAQPRNNPFEPAMNAKTHFNWSTQ